MFRQSIAVGSLALCLVFSGGSAFAAEPSLHEVYQAAQVGNYAAAQGMMDQVLKAHPNSAKAHFVEAELLAKQGQIAGARTEFATAERLDPALSFAQPFAIQSLRARLETPSAVAGQNVIHPLPAPAAPSVPWGMIIAGLALLAAIIFFIRSRSQAPTVIQAAPASPGWGNNYGAAPAYGGGVGPVVPGGGMGGGVAGGMGSGILGGLATGAAVGVGMVAGEALMHRVLDGGHQSNNVIPQNDWDNTSTQSQYDMGGNDFGVSDGGSWDSGSSSDSSSSDDWT